MSSGAKFIQFLIGLQWVYISYCFVNIAHAAPLNDQAWQAIAPGIDYQVLSYMLTPWSRIHVFRLHLKQHPLKLVRAKALGRDQAFVKELAQYAQARLAINGGFFDQAFRPLGLRVAQGQPYSALRSISWWGFFMCVMGGQLLSARAMCLRWIACSLGCKVGLVYWWREIFLC